MGRACCPSLFFNEAVASPGGTQMASEKRFEVCDKCGHKIVEGVACDVQPPECPFLKEGTQPQQAQLAQAGPANRPDDDDTHFIRGYD